MKHRLGEMTLREFAARIPQEPVIRLPFGGGSSMASAQAGAIIAEHIIEKVAADNAALLDAPVEAKG